MYCTIDDIEKQISAPVLIQLTSDDGTEEVNRDIAEEAILYSSAVIDGYLRGRYTLPLNIRACSPALNGVSGSDGVSSLQSLPASRFP